MFQIPGLSLCPVDEGTSEGSIEIRGFTSTVVVPESHKYGNCRKVNEFQKLEIIQEGAFGVLFKAHDTRKDVIVTLKSFKLLTDFRDGFPISILRETDLLKSLNHKNIISFYGTAVGRKLDSNFLILEYCPNSLSDLVERNVIAIYEESVVKSIMQQLLEGLKFIHSSRAIHRAINLQNIFFTEFGLLKISGFSSIGYPDDSHFVPSLTVLNYTAPELLFQSNHCGSGIDIWAAGCVLAELLLRKPLFDGNSELEVLDSIFGVLGTPSDDIWPGFSDLLSNMNEVHEILNLNTYNDLKKCFACFSASCYDVLKYVFLYFPEARYTAEDCLKCSYFQTYPRACSLEELTTILQAVPAIKRESNEKAWEE